MGIRNKIETAKAIPEQVKWTFIIASTALIVAVIAMAMSATYGGRRAN